MSSEDLKKYLEKLGVDARFFKFEEHTMTVDAAASRLGIAREKIIKSILFVDNSGQPVLAIVTGDNRVDEGKLAKACGAQKVRRANAAEVKEFTGYEVGAVSPIHPKKQIKTFVDWKVMRFGRVVGGGGEINALLEIGTGDLRRLTNCEVKDIGR